MVSEPLVTCAMITRPRRHALARQSARCFALQTHANRELLVLTGEGRADGEAGRLRLAERAQLERAVREEAGGRVRFLHFDEPLSLGELRNVSFQRAEGAFVCQWDDDDLSHRSRIAEQLAPLAGSPAAATMLSEVVHHFVDENVAWLCNWKRAPQGGHPGTGLFRATLQARYPQSGEESRRGEDTVFALAVQREGGVLAASSGPLYTYRFTGENTWALEHHRGLVAQLAISRALLLRREPALRAQLLEMGLPAGLEVRGSNGTAFVL